MEISVKRIIFNDDATIGKISMPDFSCYSLEPTMREEKGVPVEQWKVADKTAIPVGRYRLTYTWSPHFNRPMPLVNDVPGFSAVRVHWGNSARDTDACTLTGVTHGDDDVEQSRAAFERFDAIVKPAVDSGEEVYITYSN